MAGEISAEESLSRRIAILDTDRATVEAVGEEISRKLSPSVERSLGFFRENAPRIHVVSGGFEELILPTLERLGLSSSQLDAHRFNYDEAGRILGIDPDTTLARGGKAAAVRRLNTGGAPLWMVGDGATDLEVRTLGLADRFVAYTENKHRDPVVAQADVVARSMDELINLLENS